MTTTNTNTNTNTNTTTTNNTAQQQRKEKKRKEKKRTPKKQKEEKRSAASILLEASNLLIVGATAEGGDDWRYHMALNARLREPSVVAAARSLFPTLVGGSIRTRSSPVTCTSRARCSPRSSSRSILIASLMRR